MSRTHTQLAMKQIAELASVPASSGTSAIISAFSDQFVTKAPRLAEEEIALFDVVFMEIVRQSGVDDRILLAERFAAVPNAPIKLIGTLATDDEIRVAGPILRQSSRIDHQTLIEIASTKGGAHQASIATRKTIPHDLCEVLVNSSSPVVLIVLVDNLGADFDMATKKAVVRQAFGHPDLFVAVDRRSEFGKVIMAAYEQGTGRAVGRDADAEVAGYIGQGHIDRALAIIAMEARTRHRVATYAYQKDALETFVIIARAANLSWGTMVGLLLNQFGISISAHQINESRRLFDDTTRREALLKTRTLGMADMKLRQ